MTLHPEILDRLDQAAERREELICKRADNLADSRLRGDTMSIDDLALALEMISSRPELLDVIHDAMNTSDAMFGGAVIVTARAMIRMDCEAQARKEMIEFFAEKS